MLVSITGIVISTFSTGKRASGGMMGEVLSILCGHPDIVARIVKQNEEKLQIASTSDGKRHDKDVSTFNSYPVSEDSHNIQNMTKSHQIV
jgi:hypothetical protein